MISVDKTSQLNRWKRKSDSSKVCIQELLAFLAHFANQVKMIGCMLNLTQCHVEMTV